MKKNALLVFALISTMVFSQTNEEIDKSSTWTMVGNVQYVTQHHWRGLGRGRCLEVRFEPSVTFYNEHWNMGVLPAALSTGL